MIGILVALLTSPVGVNAGGLLAHRKQSSLHHGVEERGDDDVAVMEAVRVLLRGLEVPVQMTGDRQLCGYPERSAGGNARERSQQSLAIGILGYHVPLWDLLRSA
jgi:hypothetical protein